MRVKEIQLDHSSDSSIAFFPDSLRFFEVNGETMDVLKNIVEGKQFKEILSVYDFMTEESYEQLKSLCSEEIINTQVSVNEDIKVLFRLVLNITNVCNMQCKYCYANGGSYGSKETIMSIETLKKILDSFYDKYDNIETIQLFGGEPTLNIPAIRFTCDYVRKHEKKTEVCMVTNGSNITEELFQLIKENNINLTISIDCEELHNELRPYNSGDGTYDIIKENIRKLYKAVGQPSQIEVTYTKQHDERDISIQKMLSSLKKDIGIDIAAHVAAVCTHNPLYKLDTPKRFEESINDYFKNLGTDKQIHYSFVDRFLSVLKDRQVSNVYCGGGIGTLAVACNGDVYPCFYFTDNEDFRIGNIITDTPNDLDRQILRIRKKYLEYDRKNTEKCKNCFANNVCFGCLGINQSMTGDSLVSSDFHCKMVQSGLEATIRNVVMRRINERLEVS